MDIAVRRPRSLAVALLALWLTVPTAAQGPTTTQIQIDNFARR